ncbi:hypothetical protein ACNRBS_19530, partial [Ralstonia pseudosolanacearum]|uniref:hypothetical protein n=1 Tax=Ralstonia pseudosolanacearum TaxID=1310165 RepID=UPI003AAFFAA7
MRENWRAVGEALLVGKAKDNRESGQTFSEWCVAEGFDLDKDTRADAMWFAENFSESSEILYTHPSQIRRVYNESLRTGPLPLDLASIET